MMGDNHDDDRSSTRARNNSGKQTPKTRNKKQGKKNHERKKVIKSVNWSKSSNTDIVTFLSQKLQETKVALLYRVLSIAGRNVVQCCFNTTMELEKSGGLLSATGSRRSPGGVFLTTLKDLVTSDEYKKIYENERQAKKKFRAKVRQKRKIDDIAAKMDAVVVIDENEDSNSMEVLVDDDDDDSNPRFKRRRFYDSE